MGQESSFWDWDGRRICFNSIMGVGWNKSENPLPCHPLLPSHKSTGPFHLPAMTLLHLHMAKPRLQFCACKPPHPLQFHVSSSKHHCSLIPPCHHILARPCFSAITPLHFHTSQPSHCFTITLSNHHVTPLSHLHIIYQTIAPQHFQSSARVHLQTIY